jgi:hypothetical protein
MAIHNKLPAGVSSYSIYDKTGVSGSSPEWPTTFVVPEESSPGIILDVKGRGREFNITFRMSKLESGNC